MSCGFHVYTDLVSPSGIQEEGNERPVSSTVKYLIMGDGSFKTFYPEVTEDVGVKNFFARSTGMVTKGKCCLTAIRSFSGDHQDPGQWED